jgi:hypothetical protein
LDKGLFQETNNSASFTNFLGMREKFTTNRMILCDITEKETSFLMYIYSVTDNHGGRAVQGVDMRQLKSWDCGFKSRRWHKFLLSTATDRSLVQRSPADFRVCNLKTAKIMRTWPTRAVEPRRKVFRPAQIDPSVMVTLFVFIFY